MPFSCCLEKREELLNTDAGWAIRQKLGPIFKNADGIARESMIWWDGIYEQPTHAKQIDHELDPKHIAGESKGNHIIHLDQMEELHKSNKEAIEKVVNLVLVKGLGRLSNDKMSASIGEPLQALCEDKSIAQEDTNDLQARIAEKIAAEKEKIVLYSQGTQAKMCAQRRKGQQPAVEDITNSDVDYDVQHGKKQAALKAIHVNLLQ
ncbi:hypothetical protein OG21DRAFT_1490840 [Imleria badia]|nr:hypothetical protein OG21DRAFT_1490840 [Imleria badia]